MSDSNKDKGWVTDEAKLEQEVFRPHWPLGIDMQSFYRFACDDKGHSGTTWLQVLVAQDGDVHVSMYDCERPEDTPSILPSVRCRTLAGGGRHTRTRQALLWLARAIQLDNEEHGTAGE